MKQTPVRLPDELRKRARAHCDKEMISLSFLVRLALVEYLDRLERKPKPTDDDMLGFGDD
jgi:predicted DNA-binding protein